MVEDERASEFLLDEVRTPVPPRRPTRPYPFSEMEIGDSFTVPIERVYAVRAAMAYWTKKTGACYVARKMDSNIARVWRVDPCATET